MAAPHFSLSSAFSPSMKERSSHELSAEGEIVFELSAGYLFLHEGIEFQACGSP